jgi:hypothetical protein
MMGPSHALSGAAGWLAGSCALHHFAGYGQSPLAVAVGNHGVRGRRAPLRDASADLVYTGKGALIWMRDLTAWAGDAIRLLRPGGCLFVYEGHPATPLWSWDEDRPRLRTDRSYFGRTFVNDTFPARGAIEWQWTLGEIVTAVVAAGADILHLGEHPEPFWRMGGVAAAAWNGTLPNSFSVLARRRPPAPNIGSGHSE